MLRFRLGSGSVLGSVSGAVGLVDKANYEYRDKPFADNRVKLNRLSITLNA